MIIGDFTDTVMNLGTFAFIGFLIWLMVRELPDRRDR